MERNPFVNKTLSELQDINRNPIDGYENFPVLPLEEVVQKITPSIERVMDYVATAKKECNRRSTLLTWDESAAIYLYSMPTSFFSYLNDALRAKNRQAIKSWFAFIKLFITALEKLPSIKATVWRGVCGDVGSIFADGEVHIWWSVNSCSMDLKAVEPYLSATGTLFAINTIHGKNISSFSAFPEEYEVILMPGTHLSANCPSLIRESSLILVYLKEENLESESQPEPHYLFQLIRQKYQENASIECIMNPAKSFPIEQSYINLAIVETREQQEKEKRLDKNQLSEEILGTFEEIYGVKTSIDVKNIFDNCKDYRKQVLIFGRAGIGKTTFCRYVTFQWATGVIWQQYQLVLFFRLRSLTKNRYPRLSPGMNYAPLDLIKKEYFHHGLPEKDERLLKEQLEKSQVLWLLDGYDEIVQNIPTHLQYLLEQLLKTPHHILTSRPYLNTLPYNAQLEITGFTDDNIKEYVKQFFNQLKDEVVNASLEAQKLLRFLKCNPRIWGIAHIPVNLELICSLWCDTEWSETTMLTMTTVYDKMTEWLCRRHLDKQNISSIHMTKEDVYQHCRKDLAFLESLAFNGMESKSIILRPKLLRIAFNESGGSLISHPHLLNIGILKSLDYKPIGTRIEADKSHYFVHLSFQEYFAARYLIKALNGADGQKKKAIDFIKRHKYNQRFELVFTFASGLLIDSDDKKYINSFWDAILGEPLDLIGVRHVQLVIACIEETNCNRGLPRFNESIKSIIHWIEYFISKESDHRYMTLRASLRRSPLLVNQPEILNTFMVLHQNEDSWIKKVTYLLISGLPILYTYLDLTSLHLKALMDEDKRVQTAACEALEDMDEKAANDEVIDRLLHILESSTHSLAESACKILVKVDNNSMSNIVLTRILVALGKRHYVNVNNIHNRIVKLLESITTHGRIHRIVSALRNSNDFVRCGACRALGCMTEALKTVEVTHILMALVSDMNDEVRQSACHALGIIGEIEADVEVIDRLATALLDMNENVKCSACEALGQIGENAANIKVIDSLVTIFSHTHENVRRSVCETLGRLGGKAATTEVINSLITAVYDSDDKVRQSACHAIGKMGEKAASIEVINHLKPALRDVNEDVRYSACEALGRIGEKAVSIEVVNVLITAVQDVNKVVRSCVCEALGKIGEKAATTEVFNGLTIMLQDENEDVRYAACKALERIGEKAATIKVIDSITTVAENQDYDFAQSSCDVRTEVDAKMVTDEVIIRLLSVLVDKSHRVIGRAYDALEKICANGGAKSVIFNLIATLGEENSEYKLNAYYTLRQIGKNIATTETIDSLIGALNHKNHYVRDGACRLLGEIGEKAASIEMINSLVVACADQNDKVRQSACDALGKLGEKAAGVNVINSLMIAFRDKNEDVRYSAYTAAGQIGSKAATTELINSLVTAVGNEEDKVRQCACYALGEMGEKAANIKVVDSLLVALQDANPDIRYYACEALGKINYREATTEVIKCCMIAVSDKNDKVRGCACKTLGQIGEKTATNEVVDSLLTALFDENAKVKSIACEALGKIGEKAATNKAINSLMNALQDESYLVRCSACEAFEKIIEKADIIEVIDRLVKLAANKSSSVRSTACFALSIVRKREATNEMINCLVNALDHEGIKANFYAYEALLAICRKGINNIAVSRLATILRSENYEVRMNACELLGVVGENAATEEVIGGLLDACFDNYSAVRTAAVTAIENIFPLCSSMLLLADETVFKISSCVNRLNFKFMRKIAPEKFVESFLQTGILHWLPIIKTVLLRQGYGITVTGKAVVLYSSKEPLKLPVPNKELSEQLKKGLFNQTDKATETESMQAPEDLNQIEPKPSSVRKAKKRAYPFRPS